MITLKYAWIGVLALLVSGFAGLTTSSTTAQAQEQAYCFTEATNLCISGRIREYWEQNGGLPVFGYPITPQREETINGWTGQVQWFERNRLELHPDNARPYDVQLGLLGEQVLQQQGRIWHTFPKSVPQDGCLYFEETQQALCGEFLAAWRANGLETDGLPGFSVADNMALFGMPISPVQTEDIQGRPYQVQWLQRARFEDHTAEGKGVLFGLLGNEARRTSQPATDISSQLAFTQLVEDPNNPGQFNQDVYMCNLNAEQNGCMSQYAWTNIPQNDGQPAWSPNGQQVAFETDAPDETGAPTNWNIYIRDASGGKFVTSNPMVDGAPTWGNIPGLGWRIAFHSNRNGGQFDLFILNPQESEGNSPEEIHNVTALTNAAGNELFPSIAPNGRLIAYTANPDGGALRLYVADLVVDQGNVVLIQPRVLTANLPGDSIKPVWSPDSSRILFENDGAGNAEVYVVNADGSGGLRNLTNSEAEDGHPAWSPDGLRVAFQSNRDNGVFAIYVMNADGLNVAPLIVNAPTNAVHPAWKP
jgi:Tol biopolymer transport system component